jgi:hypothetical protein
VLVDDLLPGRRHGRSRRPRISDSELISLDVAQVLLDCPNERRFFAAPEARLGHVLPYIPDQAGFSKRLRALAPQLLQAITLLARLSPSFCDWAATARLDTSASRETVRRSALAGHGGYGYCRSHSRWFWVFRFYLLAPRTGCRSGSSSLPPRRPNDSWPPNCSNAASNPARP